jgi:hypothetical protein
MREPPSGLSAPKGTMHDIPFRTFNRLLSSTPSSQRMLHTASRLDGLMAVRRCPLGVNVHEGESHNHDPWRGSELNETRGERNE